jgi:glycosyltransferase involved in cell wall biosynthesis
MEVTVGIPAYNSHDTIEFAINSIIHQSLAKEKIKIVIANDKSKKGYEYLIDKFKPWILIDIINLNKNVGPGFARQAIIDKCDTEFITFIDSDDIFVDYFFLDHAISILKSELNCVLYRSQFIEEIDGGYDTHHNEKNWMHGKVYRLSNIKNKDIRFTLSRSHEDIEFNVKINLTLDDNESIYYDNKITYLWTSSENSITRKNNYEYSYNDGPIGSIQALIKAVKFGLNYQVHSDNIKGLLILKQNILNMLIDLYITYNLVLVYRPELVINLIKDHKYFYNNFVKTEWDELSYEEKYKVYIQNIQYRNINSNPIPEITLNQYIEILEGGVI